MMPIDQEFRNAGDGERKHVVGRLRIRGRGESVGTNDRPVAEPASAVGAPAAPGAVGSGVGQDRSPAEDGPRNAPKRRGRPVKASVRRAPVPVTVLTARHSPQGESEAKSEGMARREVDARAIALFREIGRRFNENRKKSKASAYEVYQHDLMENLDSLVIGGAMTLKEITATVTDLEVFMRENTSDRGKSQAQLLGEWLKVDQAELEAAYRSTEAIEPE